MRSTGNPIKETQKPIEQPKPESNWSMWLSTGLQQLGNVVITITKASLPADTLTFVLYRLKTLKQAGEGSIVEAAKAQPKLAFNHKLKQIYQQEGLSCVFRGMSSVMALSVPGSTAYVIGMESTRYFTNNHPVGVFFSGYIGQALGSLAGWVPSSVISEIMQLPKDKQAPEIQGKNAYQIAAHIVKQDGVKALYRGFWPQFFTFGTANAFGGTFAKYGFNLLMANGIEANVYQQFGVNAVSYALAGALTNPLDKIKTRVQLVNANKALFSHSSFFKCGKDIITNEGAKALFDGAGFRSLWLGSRQAVFFTTLNWIQAKGKEKELLKQTKEEKCHEAFRKTR